MDGELWILWCKVGSSGKLNYVNVFSPSPLLTDFLQCNLLPGYKYTLNGPDRDGLYYVGDDIYPPWAMFINTISKPSAKKRLHVSTVQEVMKKDVERTFEILLSCWDLLVKTSYFWDWDIMRKIVQTSVIIHNMIVLLRRDDYKRNLCSLFDDAVRRGLFLGANGEEISFTWKTKDVLQDHGNSFTGWKLHGADVDELMKDQVSHFSLKERID